MTPVVKGKTHHFEHGGLYNGLFLMRDRETGSHWDHITGECVHGTLQGYKLEVSSLLQMTAAQVAEKHPDAQIALSRPPLLHRLFGRVMRRRVGGQGKGFLPPFFQRTMGQTDTRLPEMTIGLGVWSDKNGRFYPKSIIKEKGGAMIDMFNGRSLLIYIDPESHVPTAMFTEASDSNWQGQDLCLDDGGVVRNGRLFDVNGVKQTIGRPQQMFTRWYGFAYTFPGCEVYQEGE